MPGCPFTRVALAAVLSLGSASGCRSGGDGPAVAGGDAGQGNDLLRGFTCGGCHIIPGVSAADGQVGPPLTDWAERSYIAGAVWNTPENLVRWIMDPAAIEPGTSMPDLDVREDQARHMAAYLFSLGDPGPQGAPHLFPVEWLEALGSSKPGF